MDVGQNAGSWKGQNYENKVGTTSFKPENICNDKPKDFINLYIRQLLFYFFYYLLLFQYIYFVYCNSYK